MKIKRTLKLINNERLNSKIVSAKALDICTDPTATDNCSEIDIAACTVGAVDYCVKDYAGCSNYSTDYCGGVYDIIPCNDGTTDY